MRKKTFFGFFLALLMGAVAITALTLKSTNNAMATHAKGAHQPQLQVVQLPATRGTIPVAIQGAKFLVNPDHGSSEAAFVVQNNTAKNIDAICVAVTVKIEDNGIETSSTNYITRNSLIHPDIREMHHQAPLAAGQEWSFATEPLDTEAGAVLKGIILQIDYVDFEDKTGLGPNAYGSKIVTKVRTGAAKYKAWLVTKYEENGRSVTALMPLLDRSQALPVSIDFGDYERTGAQHYKNHLLKAYKNHGIAELEKYLKR
jgi:hypothetical protein